MSAVFGRVGNSYITRGKILLRVKSLMGGSDRRRKEIKNLVASLGIEIQEYNYKLAENFSILLND